MWSYQMIKRNELDTDHLWSVMCTGTIYKKDTLKKKKREKKRRKMLTFIAAGGDNHFLKIKTQAIIKIVICCVYVRP